jgi:hypothetical protein
MRVEMESNIEKITVEIEKLKTIIDELLTLGRGIPALERNLFRMGASLKMLELNFMDLGAKDNSMMTASREQ